MTQDYYEELRKYILENSTIEIIVSFDDLPFKDAIVENVVLILRKDNTTKRLTRHKVVVSRLNEKLVFEQYGSVSQKMFNESRKCNFNIHINKKFPLLKVNLEKNTSPLSTYVNINQAIALRYDREKWVSKAIIGENSKRLLIGGRNINRYSVNWDQDYLLYDKTGIHSGGDETKFLVKEKIFFRRVSDRLIGALDTEQFYGLHTLVVMTPKEDSHLDINFILGLFNSKLMNFYYQAVFASTKTVFSEIGARQVAQLPVRSIDLSAVSDKKCYDSMVTLVKTITKLNKGFSELDEYEIDKKQALEKEIKSTDEKIDNLVYDLYGLTEAEIKIVEG